MSIRTDFLAVMLAELCTVAPTNPQREFLLKRGWVPLGAECNTGIEGWGRMVDGESIILPEPKALARECYEGAA